MELTLNDLIGISKIVVDLIVIVVLIYYIGDILKH